MPLGQGSMFKKKKSFISSIMLLPCATISPAGLNATISSRRAPRNTAADSSKLNGHARPCTDRKLKSFPQLLGAQCTIPLLVFLAATPEEHFNNKLSGEDPGITKAVVG